MFETAEVGHRVSDKVFRRELPGLREALLAAQFELAAKKTFPVILLIGGVDGAGKGQAVNALNAWMDPRLIETNGMGPASDEESERPRMWRFWRELPPKGRVGVFFGSWYTGPILARVEGGGDDDALARQVDEVVRFEKMLADEGALILKLWFHLSKERQRSRLEALEKDPALRWRVTKQDWQRFRLYDRFRAVAERVLRRTSRAHAPWTVIEGSDDNHRLLATGRAVLDGLRARLADPDVRPPVLSAPPPSRIGTRTILDTLDMDAKLERRAYERELALWQGRLARLARGRRFHRRSLVAVFEGQDASGKGGAIRRATAALDARFYRVVQIAAPTEEERAQPYLWRFWRHLPRRGHMTLFDRSWYGRVLVERVEGLCGEGDWLRAYGEINDFEEEMAQHGIVLAKFWLAVSKDEQERRFEARSRSPLKRFKLTDEDWRNRERWQDYAVAVDDMVLRTSTDLAPWTLVPADDKRHARIQVLKTLCDRIRAAG